MSITADQLVVAVSSRALFDLEKEHQLFEKEGYEAFKDYQVEHCDDPLQPGVAFPFVKRLIGLNAFFPDLEPFRVVALSRNSPVTARRFSTPVGITTFRLMLVRLLQANPRCLTSQPLRCRYFCLPMPRT